MNLVDFINQDGIKDLSWPANPKETAFPANELNRVPFEIVQSAYGIVNKIEEILEHAEAIGA